MATISLLRLSKGVSLSRAFGKHLLSRTAPAVSVLPKKHFVSTPAVKERFRGPETEEQKEDDVHHWLNERVVAGSLLPLIPVALAFPHPVLDTLLISGMVLHTHWRLSGVVEDYIHGSMLPTIGHYLVLFLTITTFGSLCYFNYSDVGFASAVRTLYSQL